MVLKSVISKKQKNVVATHTNALYHNYQQKPTVLHVWVHIKYEFEHCKHGFKVMFHDLITL